LKKTSVTKNTARNRLPFVFINVATTLDGKLAPANRHFIPFTSKRDQDLLLELRTKADAVMAGARTVDLAKVNLGPGGEKYQKKRLRNGLSEFNLRVVVSGSASLNPEADIFQHRFSPIILLTTGRAPKKKVARLKELCDEVKVFGETELDFKAALRWLREAYEVKSLLCEGGGEINGALFRQNLVHEVYWTVAPVIFGGRNAPTMADGEGVDDLSKATQLELKSLKKVGGELFMVYKVLGSAKR
jgi:2,5-diamino-6-(ribosylamino)-4(3H)-pyrimidinone 5'-phosphate reductase